MTADRVSEFGEALLVEILTGVVVARLNDMGDKTKRMLVEVGWNGAVV